MSPFAARRPPSSRRGGGGGPAPAPAWAPLPPSARAGACDGASSSGRGGSCGGAAGAPRAVPGRRSLACAAAAASAKELPAADALEWQRPLAIVKYPDPRLRARNARVGAVPRQQLLDLAAQMFELMYQDDGVGLAAPQVGVNVRLMVFNEEGPPGRGGPSETILVNPEIVKSSRRTEVEEEGCLSFPKIYSDVERAEAIEVRYYDADGRQQEKTLRGWVARIFQHEYDHLQGVLYTDRMKAGALSKVRERVVALEDAFVAANPSVPVRRLQPPQPPAAKGFGGRPQRR